MKVLLYGKLIKTSDLLFIKSFTSTLLETELQVYITQEYKEVFDDSQIDSSRMRILTNDNTESRAEIDMVLSIGGDGTMLSSALFVGSLGIPILGINLGRMGFLASIDKQYSQKAVEQILRKDYKIYARTMLKLETEKNLFDESPIALNDFTIQKKTTSSMVTIHSYVNDEYFNSYWCNGLIVATPTGSTAFSMSCGGPIVLPYSNNFILTAIAPHNLNIRPVVFPDDVKLSFEIESRNEELFCTLDSRFEIINSKEKLIIRNNDYKTNLVQLNGHSYFATLRNKLMWGKDVRNL